MPEKFRNKYLIGTGRLKGYDYSALGKYFINNRLNYNQNLDVSRF
jgi:hypothetical protein